MCFDFIVSLLKDSFMSHARWEDLRRFILSGNPVTELEAITLFGVATLRHLIAEMRKQGWEFQRKQTTYSVVIPRVNKYADFTPPRELETSELCLTEYSLRTKSRSKERVNL